MSSTGALRNQSTHEPWIELKNVQQPQRSERAPHPPKRLSLLNWWGGVMTVNTPTDGSDLLLQMKEFT